MRKEMRGGCGGMEKACQRCDALASKAARARAGVAGVAGVCGSTRSGQTVGGAASSAQQVSWASSRLACSAVTLFLLAVSLPSQAGTHCHWQGSGKLNLHCVEFGCPRVSHDKKLRVACSPSCTCTCFSPLWYHADALTAPTPTTSSPCTPSSCTIEWATAGDGVTEYQVSPSPFRQLPCLTQSLPFAGFTLPVARCLFVQMRL